MVGDAATGDDALAWSDIRYVVGRANRVVLDGTSGVARASRLLGILGPSGSGKTTLLNVLAGRLKTDGTATNTATTTTMRKRRARRGVATGRVAYAGDASGRGGRGATPLSYVEQDPKFFSNLTVRETLTLDAALQGGDAADVDAIIRRLGLVACADTYVGGDTGGKAVRGISGGERRRLAIAAETLCLRNARRRRDADAGAGAGGGARGEDIIGIVVEPTTRRRHPRGRAHDRSGRAPGGQDRPEAQRDRGRGSRRGGVRGAFCENRFSPTARFQRVIASPFN